MTRFDMRLLYISGWPEGVRSVRWSSLGGFAADPEVRLAALRMAWTRVPVDERFTKRRQLRCAVWVVPLGLS